MVAIEPSANIKRIENSFASSTLEASVPNLIQVLSQSFESFKTEGMTELLNEISPIEDFNNTRYELNFVGHEFREPKYSESECRELEKTYASALYVTAQLKIKQTGEIKENQIFLADIPFMTTNGTFIINGAERVVVSQLVRSPGVYFTVEEDPVTGRKMGNAKFVPYRGAWLEFETSSRDIISVKVDRKRRIPVTTFLRAIGFDSPQAILDEFKSFDTDTDHTYIKTTLDRDPNAIERKDALIELYRHIRPGEPPTLENSEAMLHNLFFNPRRYDLGRVGRYKVNKRLGGDYNIEDKTLTKSDIIAVVKKILDINNGRETPDDIDHLGNRRVRAVGELIQNQLRVGLVRMERVVKERMTINDPETTTPSSLINQRPVGAAVREFFGGSQLSQFMDQTNPLAELTHKRRLSALGPGGLSRERAGFDVRDVHHSHYGRICPIETPEGPNIGLLGSLATYARTNEFGFIETPYRTVVHELQSHDGELIGRTINEPVRDDQGKTIIRKGSVVTNRTFAKLSSLPEMNIKVQAYVTDKPEHIHYLSADDEEKFVIAQANAVLDEKGQISSEKIEVRRGEDFAIESPDQIDYMDISPKQIVSVSTALIPFLEHDDANRALMGSNMQRQAVPLLRPDAPIVSTGMERRVAIDSGQVVISDVDGEVTVCGSDYIAIRDNQGKDYEYQLRKFFRTNQGTCMNQRPIVFKGDKVYAGQPIADSSSTDGGRLALGQNVLVAFMSWEGYNFEDAIIVSERLLQEDKFTSIHIEKHECEARDTKIGPEEITRDIPNVGEESLRNLDEDGIIMPGAEVGPGDILVGKITPKGETDLSAEEKLLRAIFGEKARDVKDSSLRVPHGERGKVTKVSIFSRDNGDDLPAGANKLVRVWIAQTRKISVGDKMAGRHGNKGVISRIMPVEDMPYTADGTPVDIILNPLGVPSRMNLGQVLETHLGMGAKGMNFDAVTPVFDGASDVGIQDTLAKSWFVTESGCIQKHGSIDLDLLRDWLSERGYNYEDIYREDIVGLATEACHRIWLNSRNIPTEGLSREDLNDKIRDLNAKHDDVPPTFGKTKLYDGRTGEGFDMPVTVGCVYMLKLIHLVEDKIHARSTGPYSLITQQPLGGKAQFGGQRFGEMEVWALEAYSSAHNLQEMLTVKSDDVLGRVKTYESIIKGEDIVQPGIPESFNVLLKELQSLGLSVELLREADQPFGLLNEYDEAALLDMDIETDQIIPSFEDDDIASNLDTAGNLANLKDRDFIDSVDVEEEL